MLYNSGKKRKHGNSFPEENGGGAPPRKRMRIPKYKEQDRYQNYEASLPPRRNYYSQPYAYNQSHWNDNAHPYFHGANGNYHYAGGINQGYWNANSAGYNHNPSRHVNFRREPYYSFESPHNRQFSNRAQKDNSIDQFCDRNYQGEDEVIHLLFDLNGTLNTKKKYRHPRPYIEELKKLEDKGYRIGVWSSAMQRNVTKGIGKIWDRAKFEKKFWGIYSRKFTEPAPVATRTTRYDTVKPLNRILNSKKKLTKNRLILFDDSPEKILTIDKKNVCIVPSYEGDPTDDFLPLLVNHLLKFDPKKSDLYQITSTWKSKNENLYPEDWHGENNGPLENDSEFENDSNSESTEIIQNEIDSDSSLTAENSKEEKVPEPTEIRKHASEPSNSNVTPMPMKKNQSL